MSAPVDDRIAERRAEVRADRRRRRLRRTVLVLVLVVVGTSLVLVERSSLVALEQVRVEGVRRLAPEVVLETAGLEVGRSVLRLPLGEAESAVEALPLVASADVVRDGALGVLVRVTEAVPVLVASGDGRGSVLVDVRGEVIDIGTAPGVPRVDAVGRLPGPGERVEDLPALAAAHEVVTGLPGPLLVLVDRVTAPGPDDLELLLEDGTRVRLGDAERLDEKARALGAVLEDLDGTPVVVVDVRAPSAPTVVPA